MAEITGRVGWRNYVSPLPTIWNNLTHYYSGDNNANDSKGTAHGTLMNGTAYSSAKINNGFNMDGVNDFVQLPDDTFKFLGDFSISFWIYKKSNNTPLYLAALKAGDVWYSGFYMYNSGGGIATVINGWDVTTSSIIPSNQWTHVVFTHKQSTINRFYVNGVLNNTSSGVRNSTVNPNHSTGVILSTIGYAWSPDAIMDEVATFDTELTASQVSELYNDGAGKQYVAPAPAYTARTTAFAAATGITDTTILNALNTFDTGLISNGLDTKMKALYPMVGGTSTTHKFNFMDARDSDAAFRLAFNGGWVHSSTGALPNGTNAYANTYITPSTNLDADNLSMSYYSRTNTPVVSAQVLLSSFVNASSVCGLFFESNVLYFDNYNNTPYSGRVSVAESRSQGMYMGNRLDASINKIVRNGTVIESFATGGTGIRPTFSIYMAASNYQGSAVVFSSLQTAFASIGNGLTDAEALTFYNLVQAMQTSLSRNV